MIALASDHAGFPLKEDIKEFLQQRGYTVRDFGPVNCASVDYPDYALAVAEAVAQGQFQQGILICGTGIGMSMVANKVKGIRAALCQEPFSARMSREHNNANILCLGQRILGTGLAQAVVEAWLEADFAGDRHKKRLEKITQYEGGEPFEKHGTH